VSNFFKRTLTGAIFVIVVIGSVLMGPYTFAALFLIVNILGLAEFYSLLEKNGTRVQKFSGIFQGSFLLVIVFLHQANSLPIDFLFLSPALLLFLFANELFLDRPNPFSSIAYTLLGIIYISLSLSLFILIPFVASGGSYNSFILIGYFVILWTSDTAAYLVGSRFGKTRLMERISPKKSWEGVIGGIVCGLIAAYVLSNYYPQFTLLQWLLIAMVIMVTGIIGDLVESMFKRNIQVKDTGHILPGHGGILDRFDALIFSAPFVFITVYLLSR
jgi:phosphatidate cytidylyltransferase